MDLNIFFYIGLTVYTCVCSVIGFLFARWYLKDD